jgi:hypothetical protein
MVSGGFLMQPAARETLAFRFGRIWSLFLACVAL